MQTLHTTNFPSFLQHLRCTTEGNKTHCTKTQTADDEPEDTSKENHIGTRPTHPVSLSGLSKPGDAARAYRLPPVQGSLSAPWAPDNHTFSAQHEDQRANVRRVKQKKPHAKKTAYTHVSDREPASIMMTVFASHARKQTSVHRDSTRNWRKRHVQLRHAASPHESLSY